MEWNHSSKFFSVADNDNNNRSLIFPTAAPESEHRNNACPDCDIPMIRLGHCFTCPRCGYGGCG